MPPVAPSRPFLLMLPLVLAAAAFAETPQVLVEGVTLELVAEHPRIVTPVGMTCDQRGDLLVVESHTHFPAADYPGPSSDRILRLRDGDGDGNWDEPSVFHEGERHLMCVASHPNGWIYATTRSELFRLRDDDGDGVADQRESLARLETSGDYPHNGLSGIAIDGDGGLFVGLGENLGEAYALRGRDGAVLRGGGEGGNIYHINAEGGELTRFATGFWNPFGLCVDSQQRLFAVGNDPDSRPPCRLLHVAGGGDYGYQFRYGRSGLHPLQAWNGELPATLPYVAGTGEAPSDVMEFRGALWVASWGHNRIERFELTPAGASWKAHRRTIVRGDEMFRPVAFAVGAEGSLFFSDWVDRSYNVHRQGRIWRLRFAGEEVLRGETPPLTEAEIAAGQLEDKPAVEAWNDPDPFIRQAVTWGFARRPARLELDWERATAAEKVGLLSVRRWVGDADRELLLLALRDASADVRMMAVRTIADGGWKDLAPDLQAAVPAAVDDARLLAALLAALDYLESNQVDDQSEQRRLARRGELLWSVALDPDRSPGARRSALRLAPVGEAGLRNLRTLIETDSAMCEEAVWKLADASQDEARRVLAQAALNPELPESARASAVVGLTGDVAGYRSVLGQLTRDQAPAVAAEARRAVSPSPPGDPHPAADDLDAWMQLVGEGGDPDAGRRLFFSPSGPGCYRCHRHQHRGEQVGPELTRVAEQWDRRRLLVALLQPSRDIAPQFRSEILQLADGRVLTGVIAGHRNEVEPETNRRIEQLLVVDAAGRTTAVDANDIEFRQASPLSLMPQDLLKSLTIDEIRNLLAMLSAP